MWNKQKKSNLSVVVFLFYTFCKKNQLSKFNNQKKKSSHHLFLIQILKFLNLLSLIFYREIRGLDKIDNSINSFTWLCKRDEDENRKREMIDLARFSLIFLFGFSFSKCAVLRKKKESRRRRREQ